MPDAQPASGKWGNKCQHHGRLSIIISGVRNDCRRTLGQSIQKRHSTRSGFYSDGITRMRTACWIRNRQRKSFTGAQEHAAVKNRAQEEPATPTLCVGSIARPKAGKAICLSQGPCNRVEVSAGLGPILSVRDLADINCLKLSRPPWGGFYILGETNCRLYRIILWNPTPTLR